MKLLDRLRFQGRVSFMDAELYRDISLLNLKPMLDVSVYIVYKNQISNKVSLLFNRKFQIFLYTQI